MYHSVVCYLKGEYLNKLQSQQIKDKLYIFLLMKLILNLQAFSMMTIDFKCHTCFICSFKVNVNILYKKETSGHLGGEVRYVLL